MVAISQLWYNGSYTIAAKPIKMLESHYTMIQFLIMLIITQHIVALSKCAHVAHDICHPYTTDVLQYTFNFVYRGERG